MHQRRETIQAKRKTSSINSHLSNSRRRKEPVRRAWSHGLPSLAKNTVNMVVATLNIGTTMSELNEEKVDKNDQQDDDDDNILNIGQQVEAHIPDIVLRYLNDSTDRKGSISIPNEHKYNNATLLFLDVSGFTSLTEQYSNAAHLGVDQLTRTLNLYFNKLVCEILAQDGDIYKFAGDAILALWTNEITGPQQALKCALNLQQKCGVYETDVGVILRVKVALAYGHVRALFVGTEEFKHYLLSGDCIKNVNVCEQLCEPGDIIITKTVYDKLQSTSFNCEFQPVSDEIDPKHEHIAVKYSLSRRSSVDESSDTEEHINNTTIIHDRMDIPPNQEITNNNDSSENNSSNEELDQKIDLLMKSFLLRCVYQRIERKQSLDYLSELRRVTISFINLDISNEQKINDNLAENLQKIFIQIYESTKMMGGVLTKALLFDKGWSFLCVFGLPGYKQGDDTANALKSAQMIHSTIREKCQFVVNCSIGVTTGLTYCGVVGHMSRCEYTVIGRKVNMAARLMCNYPNIISCDQETYYNSRLNTRFFQILPDKILKGMNNVGVIWHYGNYQDMPQAFEENKTANDKTTDIRHENYPLLGRKVELMIVVAQLMLLDEPINSSNRRKDLAAIIFEGEDKIGRSRLLQFIADALENTANNNNLSAVSYYDTYIPSNSTLNNNSTLFPSRENETERRSSLSNYANDCSVIRKSSIRVINYNCQFEQRFNEFSLLRSLLKQLLQFHNNDKTQYEREQYVLRLFDINKTHDLHLRRSLFLLNDLLDVRFRRNHIEIENTNENNLVKAYETSINELILHILNKLIDPPNNIGEMYLPMAIPQTINTSSPIYLQARISSGSTSSLTSPPSIATVSKIIFIIDDIHFADESSLKHLLTLGSHNRCLLILSMKPPRNNNNDRPNSNTLQSISTDSRVYLRRLPGLELRHLATLGCQMLSVHRVPAKLVKVFNESCNGIPGFCEQILFDLLSKDIIHIVDDNNNSADQDSSLMEGDADKLVVNNPIKIGLFKTLFSGRNQQITCEQRENEHAFSRICLLRNPKANDFNADCQQNFQNYIMCRIDRLSEGESLLVKIATIIGSTFSRIFLWHLVDPQSKTLINITSCILDMMQRNIIECAFNKQQTNKTRSIKCFCLQNPAGFPSQCRLMAFTHSTIRDGIYNALTDGLKRALTRSAIDYLEKQCTPVCLTCGANRSDTPFLVQDQDGLAKIIKSSHQHALVDIVKMAALKEIDTTIKQLSRVINSPAMIRSDTTSTIQPEPATAPVGIEKTNEFEQMIDNSTNNHFDKRHISYDASDIDSSHFKNQNRTPCSMPSVVDDEITAEDILQIKDRPSLRRNSSDPNLTLISVFSHDAEPTVQVNLQRTSSSSTPSTRKSQLFSLFKIPKSLSNSPSAPNSRLLQPVDGVLTASNSQKVDTIVETSKKRKQETNNRFISFIRYFFCQFVPDGSDATVAPTTNNQMTDNNNNDSSNDNQASTTDTTTQVDIHSKENEIPLKFSSHWRKVRKAVLPSSDKFYRALPTEEKLLEQPMFSPELMERISSDLSCLNKQIHLTRTFEVLYNQSLVFYIFQSYVQHKNLIQYVYDNKQTEEQTADLTEFLNEFNSYSDLRTCECADYVMSVYIKLVEYHTNLYDIYEKIVDDKRDYLRLKQFDRIMYYRREICQLLLRCNCLQRVLVEIENGRIFLEKFQNSINNQEDFTCQYHYFIVKYSFNFFQAIVLQRTRAIRESKQLCEQSLKELNDAYQDKIWEKLILNSQGSNPSSANERRHQFEQSKEDQMKEVSVDTVSTYTSQSSTTANSEQLILFNAKYRLEYLLCQYNLLQYNLSRHQSVDSINTLIDLQYHTFPLVFSLPCTIILVEHFYYQMDYKQCLILIDKIIKFWWIFINPREKLEFAKLKCLALIIELKQGSFESAILSGYFAKRVLTGYHENIFLIESCIYLTLTLIGQMRISNIELMLQHLEYLSEQTMDCYAKLWYYILIIDVAMELGYELLPITLELLDNVAKYRKKLVPGENQRSLLLIYSDCILAQIYARLGILDISKIYFHQVLHQIKYEQMYLSNIDFRFKRVLLKLVEIQLLHWYHTKEYEENLTKECFLLNYFNEFNSEVFLSWNKTRFLIYQAYYDRLINDYRREKKYAIDNDFNWEASLHEAEQNAVKLDSEWIKCLRRAWLHPVSEQIELQGKQVLSNDQARRATIVPKQTARRFIRSSVPQAKISLKTDMNTEKNIDEQSVTKDNYSHQKFIDWRLFLNPNNSPQFQLYILPVRV